MFFKTILFHNTSLVPIEANKTQYSNSPFDDGTMETGNALLNSIIEEKKRRWEEVITSTNMTDNSRQAWKTIRMLSNDPTSSSPPCLVSANQVAQKLLVNGRGNMPPKPKRPVIPKTEAGTSMVSPFSEDVQERSGYTEEQQSRWQRRRSGGATKESWSQSSQMAARNVK